MPKPESEKIPVTLVSRETSYLGPACTYGPLNEVVVWPVPTVSNVFFPLFQVTGFLGSGKTTLLNHILRQKGARRVAVIENEVRGSYIVGCCRNYLHYVLYYIFFTAVLTL